MESVPPGYDHTEMDILITIVAILAALMILMVGMFSLASIFFDDLP